MAMMVVTINTVIVVLKMVMWKMVMWTSTLATSVKSNSFLSCEFCKMECFLREAANPRGAPHFLNSSWRGQGGGLRELLGKKMQL